MQSRKEWRNRGGACWIVRLAEREREREREEEGIGEAQALRLLFLSFSLLNISCYRRIEDDLCKNEEVCRYLYDCSPCMKGKASEWMRNRKRANREKCSFPEIRFDSIDFYSFIL